jgi:hypothetical protein
MTELFNRRAVLQMGTVQVDGLRIAFKVEKTGEVEPNKGEIQVYNLSKDTRSRFISQADFVGPQRNTPVILQAGYGDDIEQIFNGDILPSGITTKRAGPDWITTFRLGDGATGYQTDRVQLSLAKGAKFKDALLGILDTMTGDVKNVVNKVRSGEIKDVSGLLTEFSNGVVLSGRSMDEFNKLVGSTGYQCSWQDGKLEVVAKGKFIDETVPSLGSDSGLIGSPEPGKEGLTKFRCFLRPKIKVYRRVQVISAAQPQGGYYLIAKVAHLGDTGGGDWFTDCEGRPL